MNTDNFFLNHGKVKFEPDLFYYACDKMGIMIIQDMPSMSGRIQPPDAAQQAEFETQLDVLVNEHLNYPSIVTWVCSTHHQIEFD